MARPRRSRRTLATLVVLVLLSVTIITLDETGKAQVLFSGLKTAASDVYSPLRAGVNGVLDPIGRFFAGAVNYGSLQAENETLREELQTLEHKGDANGATAKEYTTFERLLRLNSLPALSGLKTVLVQVTADGGSDFATTVTIDKGRDAGVTDTDPVLGPGGLVGQVVIATRTTATVRLLTDAQSYVGVTYGHHQEATVQGQGPGRPLGVEYVSASTPISTGQHLVTSGLQGAAYPAGIPVASVSSVHTVAGAADRQVHARPVVGLNGLSYLEVVVWSGST